MEDIITVAIVFGSLLAALKLILDFAASKRRAQRSSKDPMLTGTERSILDSVGLKRSGSNDRSMTATELSKMIEDTVSRSLGSVEKRIQNLEAIVVDRPMLAEHREQDRIDLPDELADGESESSSVAAGRLKS